MNNTERQTCARTIEYKKVSDWHTKKLKKVRQVKFLGVMIDDELSWEPQVEYLRGKVLSRIVVIKRIKKFIPECEYINFYNSLFKSHLSYCISSWAGVVTGISSYKLEKIFCLQKRCVRLLFGHELNFDHSGYYEACAWVRTLEKHKSKNNFVIENTKGYIQWEEIAHPIITFTYTIHSLNYLKL